MLKTFYNGKKVPFIPPLPINNTLVTDFKNKANIFNTFFESQCVPLKNDSNIQILRIKQTFLIRSLASQCVPLNNDSNIPCCQRYMTNTKMSSIKSENKDIINVIKALDRCRAHGYDDISIRMLKICDSVVVKSLTINLQFSVSIS